MERLMSEAWPYLLIAGYAVALIFSVFKQRTLFREEINFFCFYLLAGLAAAVWARVLTDRKRKIDAHRNEA
jgi:hypothetical protein